MNEKRVQIHLSTAAVLMLTASLLLYLNTRTNLNVDALLFSGTYLSYGFPFSAYILNATGPSGVVQRVLGWQASGIVMNGLLSIFVLIAVSLQCEKRFQYEDSPSH